MIWYQIQTLALSFLVHAGLSIGIVSVTWFLVAKWNRSIPFHWGAAIALGFGISVLASVNTLVGLSQTQALIEARAKTQSAAESQAAQAQTQAVPRELQILQMKAEFLRTVDLLAAQPAQITPDLKKQIFEKYSPLFPSGDSEKKIYLSKISRAYECQKFVIEDALTAKKSKKALKSQDRAACEKEDGTFFNRDRLITPEILASNNSLVENAASDKGKGTDKEITEATLRTALEDQIRRSDAVKRIFE